MTEANEVTTAPKDRPFLTAIVGLAAAIALGLIVFVFVSDFPGPSPAGGDTTKSERHRKT